MYKDLNSKKDIIIEFIKKNPNATYREIKNKLHLHVSRVFIDGMKEAYKSAGVKPPRTFDIKTKDEKRKIIIDYIRKHPGVGGHTIAKETKINPSNVFNNIIEAYDLSGINYPRPRLKKSKEQKRQEIIQLIKNNYLLSADEIREISGLNPYKSFNNFKELYNSAGIDINIKNKRLIKKQQKVIQFIRENKFATQREINKNCKTHVQDIFNNGIFDAYKEANVDFPYERLRLYGIGIKSIRDNAKRFEEEISVKLSGYGKVNRLVKTKRGFADVIFERNDKKAVIEIKDYNQKDISISQINQLNKYLEDCKCNLGFLICHNKPKKDSFIIGKNRIFVLDVEEVKDLPSLMDS